MYGGILEKFWSTSLTGWRHCIDCNNQKWITIRNSKPWILTSFNSSPIFLASLFMPGKKRLLCRLRDKFVNLCRLRMLEDWRYDDEIETRSSLSSPYIRPKYNDAFGLVERMGVVVFLLRGLRFLFITNYFRKQKRTFEQVFLVRQIR